MKHVRKIRPILQMENMECGATCLAMILEYYGKKVPVEVLRQECGVSRNGVNALYISKAAMHHGLIVNAYKTEPCNLKNIKMPAIIHWNMDHFIVLTKVTKKGIVAADPEKGLRNISFKEVDKCFTGVVLEFQKGEDFCESKEAEKESYIKNCTDKVKGYYATFIFTEICAVLGSFLMMFINSSYIDKILESGNKENLRYILIILFISELIVLFGTIIGIYYKFKLGKKLNFIINFDFLGTLLSVPMSFYEERNRGELAGRAKNVMEMGQKISDNLYWIYVALVRILIYTFIVFALNIKIATVGIIAAVVNMSVLIFNIKKRENITNTYLRDMGALQDNVSKTVNMIETIKASGAEDIYFKRLIKNGNDVINDNKELEKMTLISDNVFTFLNLAGSGAVLIMGVFEILSGRITVGFLVALGAIIDALLASLEIIAGMGREFEEMKFQSYKTDDIMNYHPDRVFNHQKKSDEKIEVGTLEFKNVCFSYNPLDNDFIKDLSFKIEGGKALAITGKSGSGKSTVAKLILGITEKKSGEILIDKRKISDFNQYYFYKKVAMVSQDVKLFDGTVLDNIRMWDKKIPYEKVVEAAKAAFIHEDIIMRQSGYYEHVCENGKNFSGGQRQKIEIARAIVKEPKILVLDEATSAIDAESEKKIIENIKRLKITTVIVAHRLSTIRDADKIIVMDKGDIKEEGTHKELIERDGEYKELIRSVK